MTQELAGKTLGATARSLKLWKRHDEADESLEIKIKRWRKSEKSWVGKIIIIKSLKKRHFFTLKLAKKLTVAGHPVSCWTVHKYLKKIIACISFHMKRNLQTFSFSCLDFF